MVQKSTATEDITHFLASPGYIAIPIQQNVAGQLLINAKINDVEGVYILDTGAGQTVVDAKQAEFLKLKLSLDEAELTGGGVGAHGLQNIPSYNNKLEIDQFRIDNFAVAVMALHTAWESLAQAGAHDELVGIIGVDVLKKGNAFIDFSTMKLYLMPLSY